MATGRDSYNDNYYKNSRNDNGQRVRRNDSRDSVRGRQSVSDIDLSDLYEGEEWRREDAYYEQRRKARKARRERERRRRKRRRIIAYTVVAGAAVLIAGVVLVHAGVLPWTAGAHGALTGDVQGEDTGSGSTTGEIGASERGSLSDGTEESGAGLVANAAAANGDNETDTAEAESGESGTDDSEEGGSGTGIFVRTAATIDLGQSQTDISIYDDQRHITHEDDTDTGSDDAQDDASMSSTGAEGAPGGSENTDGTSGSGQNADGSASENTGNESGNSESNDGTTSNSDSAESSSEGSSEDPALAPDYVDSQYVILVNADTGEIVAERNGEDRIVPASMTKVMTLLVAVEAMDDIDRQLEDTFEITQEITDATFQSGSSMVGYGVGDEAKVEDLLYGAILPSGADAAMALAEYTAGSQEAFAVLMNEKAEELGILDTTHFTNCVGLYDEDHYSTPYDMAVIMKAAYENDLCRKVLSTHTWTTAATANHPEGIEISNWFLRKIEDHIDTGIVECAKTGFVNESGNCAVSTYTSSSSGTHYIACTALTYNSWRCIFDHANLYANYAE